MAGVTMRGVFVVDDDLDCRIALGEVLEDTGLSPILFADPREALAALAQTPPALIVTEIGKVGTPGAGPYRALLAAAMRAELPVIVFSGWNRTAAGLRLPFPFVAKPEVQVLLEMVRALAPQPLRQTAAPGPARPRPSATPFEPRSP
jgi:FixJ family two-component response regulator